MKLKITSKMILLCLSLVLLTSIVFGALSYYQNRQSLVDSLINEKEKEILLLSSLIESKADELKNDARFLSSTPPIAGIIRAENNNGFDPSDKSTSAQWKDRISIIFTEIMYAKKNYDEISLIGIKNEEKELVRVHRKNNKILRTKSDDLLRQKNKNLFKKGIKKTASKIHLSEFYAKEVNNKVLFPIEMVLSAVVPIYEGRLKPFGLIEININYNKIFNDLQKVLAAGDRYFVADQNGSILLHSDKDFYIGTSEDELTNIKSYMPEIKNDGYKNRIQTQEVKREKDLIVISHRLRYSSTDIDKYLSVYLVVDKNQVVRKAFEASKNDLILVFFLIILTTLFAIYFSRIITAPIKKLNSFAETIGEEGNSNRIEIESEDEIGQLGQKLNQMADEIILKDYALIDQKKALDESAIVAETDANGIITYVNDKFIEISKYERDELIGKDHRVLNSGHHQKLFFKNLWETIQSGKVWHGEVKNRAKDGSFYWVDTTIYPVLDEFKKVSKYVAIRFDTTEKKLTLLELESANVIAKKAVEAKTAFLANMSHEIRTPLNGIFGFTDLILAQDLSPEVLEQAEYIKACSESLMLIVNDILDISKIEAGKLNIVNENYDLREAIDKAMFIFKSNLAAKNIKLKIEVSDSIPKKIFGDPLRFRQILVNLVGNAVKFTQKGSIILKVDIERVVDSQEMYLICKIKDTGIGIPEIAMDRLFHSFEQVDSTTTREYGGTGLGLSICSKLVKLMDGKIWVESQEHKGSEFSFTIKVKIATKENEFVASVDSPLENIQDKALEGSTLKILVAEDNKINQVLIKKVLSKIGFLDVIFANNGREAVSVVQENDFDIIFMDVQMPVMDGLEATRTIRALLDSKVKIIGLSANVLTEDKSAGIEAGMDDYLEKPINVKKLLSILSDYSQKRAS